MNNVSHDIMYGSNQELETPHHLYMQKDGLTNYYYHLLLQLSHSRQDWTDCVIITMSSLCKTYTRKINEVCTTKIKTL